MAQRLSRRRFAEVMRFLKNTVKDERIAHKIRMRAAERLIEVYAGHDRAVERHEARKSKAGCENTPNPQHGQDEAVQSQETVNNDAGARLASLFDEVLKPKEQYAG